MASNRETPFPLPPYVEHRENPLPDALTGRETLIELNAHTLEMECQCQTVAFGLRHLAAQRGWETPLAAIVDLFICTKICRQRPHTILLIEDYAHFRVPGDTPRRMLILRGHPDLFQATERIAGDLKP